METKNFPYQAVDWAAVPRTEHKGETGTSWWRTLELPGLRIRTVEYSPGYLADHWCQKGHIVYCLEGEFVNEQQDGENTVMRKGMTYQAGLRPAGPGRHWDDAGGTRARPRR